MRKSVVRSACTGGDVWTCTFEWMHIVARWVTQMATRLTRLVAQPPPPPLYELRPCPSDSRRRDRINLVPNLIQYKCSAVT